MKKIILLGILAISLSSNTLYAGPKIETKINLTWKENLLNAVKKFTAFAFKSKYAHGAAAGAAVSLLTDVLIKSIFEQEKYPNSLLKRHEPKPKSSVLIILVASIYGAYLSSDESKTFKSLVIDGAVSGAALGLVYLIWNLVRERTSDEVEQYTFKSNLKASAKQTFLNIVATMSAYGLTKKFQELDY
jgi:hypothetical protein